MTRYGLFRFGSLAYAVPLLRLSRIVQGQRGYRLPRLPEQVAEVLIEGAALVPLLRLPALTAGGEISTRTVPYKVLAETEAGMIALPAAENCGIVAAAKGQLEPSDRAGAAAVTAVFNYRGEQFKVLDIDALAFALTETA